MPGQLRVAFWNVQNLFEVGVVPRGPQSTFELDAKTGSLATVIDSFFRGSGPDLIGLAEINTRRILEDLAGRLQGGPYLTVWEDAGVPEQTGLGCLARASVFANLQVVAVQRPSIFARPRALIVRAELRGIAEPILVVVNHWKSRLPAQPISDEDDRRATADWLGQALSQEHRLTCVIVFGDFNAEPFEAPFGELRLRAKRFFSSALWSQATPAYLYNAAWRWLCEPEMWEATQIAGYSETRPKTTHGSDTPCVFDHLMVSGYALRNGPVTLEENSVQCVAVDGSTASILNSGKVVPRRWSYVSPTEFTGVSDHFPITATFSIR